MDIVLVDLAEKLCEAWRDTFIDVQTVRVHHGRFESLVGSCDCMVSPANSFGLMDGGIDLAIIDYFGVALQERVQQGIWHRYRGEQPVGTCLMVATDHPRCPWLAHCPTMRVPMDVSWTNHAYAAFLAALTTAEAHGVTTMACPGLATLTGRMPALVAARQMRFAFDIWSSTFRPPVWSRLHEREWRSYGRTQSEFLRHQMPLPNEASGR